jgi:uncharacterized protein YcnI
MYPGAGKAPLTTEAPVTGATTKSFSIPDEHRSAPDTVVDVVHLDTHTMARFTFAPGWRWSTDVAPVAGTDSCQARHVGSVQSGVLHVTHNDGSQIDVTTGDAYLIEPGHNAWVVGEEPAVLVEFESADTYGRSPTAGIDVRDVYEND